MFLLFCVYLVILFCLRYISKDKEMCVYINLWMDGNKVTTITFAVVAVCRW